LTKNPTYASLAKKPNWPPLLDCYSQKTDVLRSPVVIFPKGSPK